MKIAVMQPYFCPHVGYFQLVDSVDIFVFYDDVQYIKRGYINRNTLKDEVKFTIPVSNASTKKKIFEVDISWDNPFFSSFYKTLQNLYGSSESYEDVLHIIKKLFDSRPKTISELACNSIKFFSEYLGIQTEFLNSSELNYIKSNDKSMNLINVCKSQSVTHYINSIGGQKLYCKDFFKSNGIDLNFIDSQVSTSIIDQLMKYDKVSYLRKLQSGYKFI